jgi:cell wall-associated NlpC family hydrolase
MDKRITPARPDLAAAHLEGQVQAARFAPGEAHCVIAGMSPLRAEPSDEAAQDTQLLFGETFTVYDMFEGWAWGQAARDGYVGYVKAETLDAPFTPDAQVTVLSTPVLARPDVKAPLHGVLPLGARVPQLWREGDYVQVDQGAFVYAPHLAALDHAEPDFVAVAERFIGAPYVWGGKTVSGLDCSGLIQAALQAAGRECPRDADMQQAFFTQDAPQGDLRRGDLVFWKGHVGVMLDAARLLHANAFHMLVAAEPLSEAIARIEHSAGPVTAIKRP